MGSSHVPLTFGWTRLSSASEEEKKQEEEL